MEAGHPSWSAMGAAEARASHRIMYPPPWILDDPFALALLGAGWEELAAESRSTVPEPMLRRARAGVAMRARYTEDLLAEGGYAQYVILGAGLDSFAWRRGGVGTPAVFEVDHPASQKWKRARIAELGLPTIDGRAFVPVDFEIDTLRVGLGAAGFDWSEPALFSCVGVMMYLTIEAMQATLRTVAAAAPSSQVVLSYNPDPAFLDETGRQFLAAVSKRVAGMGEPLQTFLSPDDAEAYIESSGLDVAEHPGADDLGDKYGVKPLTTERFIVARVRPAP